MTTPEDADARTLRLEGLAALALTAAEMGQSADQIVQAVGALMSQLGMTTAADVRAVAATIATLPQPLDEAAEIRERKRPIEEMLGVTSPEDQLASALRAVEALIAFAEQLEAQSDS